MDFNGQNRRLKYNEAPNFYFGLTTQMGTLPLLPHPGMYHPLIWFITQWHWGPQR